MESQHPDFDQQTQWKLKTLFGDHYEKTLGARNLKRSEELIKAVLEKLSKDVIQSFKTWQDEKKLKGDDWQETQNTIHGVKGTVQEIKEVKENVQEAREKVNDDEFNKFENWGETVSTTYEQIYYPTIQLSWEWNYQKDLQKIREQITQLQQFVRKNYEGEKKRIRGAGIRHSWSNVFSDPNQLLVSFYPYKVATGTSHKLEKWARDMSRVESDLAKEGVQHLNMLRKVGEIPAANGVPKKNLIKIGAGVSNEQLRTWCSKNNVQYKSNVIMVEVNLCGGLGTCSHGAGIGTQTLADYVYAIQFIDHTGKRQEISKATRPDLINSAASNLGLLGLTIFVTMEMEDLDVIQFLPTSTYKDFVIPYPKSYTLIQKEKRKLRPEYLLWLLLHGHKHPTPQQALQNFKDALNNTYCQWFYFPIQGSKVFQNNWNSVVKLEKVLPDVEKNLKTLTNNPQAKYFHDYPPEWLKTIGELSLFVGNRLINDPDTQQAVNIFMRIPFLFFPRKNYFVNYPDAVHFQRGIQNMKVRDIEVEINIPVLANGDIDYDLIQEIWWTGMEYVEQNAKDINIALEMRVFKGSNATLAPEIGYQYVCSIEILRSLTLDEDQKQKWAQHSKNVFEKWSSLKDSNNNELIIRPHWGKEWNEIPVIKDHLFNKDPQMKEHIQTFLKDYEKIAEHCNFNKDENLSTFSNELYRELLNNAIGSEGPRIQ